ncbi:reverse transcriptase domain-containing protein [Tanacetum coccineum]
MSSNTYDYIYPIIVPSDFDVEDVFSSTNTPDYTPASLDYSLASSGNTSPNPSDDLSKYLLASLAISPFHDDPYMKVMQAYNATSNESPIPRASIAPPTVLPPSPRNFNQLETELQEARTQISGFQREKIRHDDEMVLACVRISTMDMIIEDIQCCLVNVDRMASKRTSTSTAPAMTQVWKALLASSAGYLLTEEALSWWNSFAQPIGIEEAYKITWSEFKMLLIKKYCPRTEVKKMEDEFYNLTVKGHDLKTYIRRFQELGSLMSNYGAKL